MHLITLNNSFRFYGYVSCPSCGTYLGEYFGLSFIGLLELNEKMLFDCDHCNQPIRFDSSLTAFIKPFNTPVIVKAIEFALDVKQQIKAFDLQDFCKCLLSDIHLLVSSIASDGLKSAFVCGSCGLLLINNDILFRDIPGKPIYKNYNNMRKLQIHYYCESKVNHGIGILFNDS